MASKTVKITLLALILAFIAWIISQARNDTNPFTGN